MSEITEIIHTLEGRIAKLIQKTGRLESTISELRKELDNSALLSKKQSDEIESLKSACETLRVANSLLGSEDSKRETKLKINSLIREIDYCIAQLAD